jgi:hypothetical protein
VEDLKYGALGMVSAMIGTEVAGIGSAFTDTFAAFLMGAAGGLGGVVVKHGYEFLRYKYKNRKTKTK